MSSTTGCFQHVVLLEIPDLEGVDHFPILAAVVGILLALFKEDLKNFRGKVFNLNLLLSMKRKIGKSNEMKTLIAYFPLEKKK